MAVVDTVAFWVGLAIVLGSVSFVSYMAGRQNRQPTRIVPVARKVDNRVVSKHTRAERRAWKRRRRG